MNSLPAPAEFDLDSMLSTVAPLYLERRAPTGEPLLHHAEGLVQILRSLRAEGVSSNEEDRDLLAAALLFSTPEVLRDADEWLAARFGTGVARLVANLRQLMKVSERTRALPSAQDQAEVLRKMVLAMASDVRVVLLRLASRLQTLRWFAQSKQGDASEFARETLTLYAPLANRLGVWQLKWELEDLAFRFLEPATYKYIATQLDAKRREREHFIDAARIQLARLLADAGITAEISGRPKHIYSIWTKMRGKQLDFDQVYDVRALRVIVSDVVACYQTLSLVHEHYSAVPSEYDDYIARPKPNGYQSLHTVVLDQGGHALEIQIRTRAMHEFAELGLAAHWHYKESSSGKTSSTDTQRVAWLRRLLAWREEVQPAAAVDEEERIYVLTPQGRVVELPAGASPIDFAYYLHTDLGHRCRGARIDGAMVPLNTRLHTGQTVEIITAKTGGPSRDWLNPELGYLASPRSRAKVRHWFNLVELAQTIAAGRDILDRELARLGRSAVKLDDLAQRLGFAKLDELSAAVTKDDFNLRSIEQALNVVPAADEKADLPPALRHATLGALTSPAAKGQVLVVGVDELLTSLARCCRPVPPDEIVGFITRGKGVSVHRAHCVNAAALAQRHPERFTEVSWDETGAAPRAGVVYPVDLTVLAQDRPGLLRDIGEVFAREKLNVLGTQSQSRGGRAQMQFTVGVSDGAALRRVLTQVGDVRGVFAARRRAS